MEENKKLNNLIKSKVRDFLIENSNYFRDEDYEYYINNAKISLNNIKKIEGVSKGITRMGDKYVVITYIPKVGSVKFDGGEWTKGLKIFYKDDKHLDKIMKELNLSIDLDNL